MLDFDELVAWPGRGTHIALGRVIHEIKSGWAPPSLHVDLLRAQGCEPAIYTMADGGHSSQDSGARRRGRWWCGRSSGHCR